MIKLKRKDRLELGLLKLGEIAPLAGVLPSAIRYYSNLGLLQVSEYTQGKYRLFNKEETLDRMAKINEFKEQGLALDEIKVRIGLSGSAAPNSPEMDKNSPEMDSVDNGDEANGDMNI